ncbi:uncharacterized protein LOC135486668 [Lineus longissimus]|uniref:uncharacterized protein LOC135486668 n=1 Tax=Lineus longissimus TaxID=88925 RepID=UPI002B4D3B3E
MGAGAGKSPEYGVRVNPRVDYAERLGKKAGKDLIIDAPAIIDLQHGTIRYREIDEGRKVKKAGRIERPHEGPERDKKHGYFYHSRLTDFSENADEKKEEEFKFYYVFQGPNRTKQKQLHYVFGRGMGAIDPGIVRKSDKPSGKGYVWPTAFRQPNHIYYDLHFIPQTSELEPEDDADDVREDVTAEKTMHYTMKLDTSDTAGHVKERLAVRQLKSAINIHIIRRGAELMDEEVIGDLRSPNQEQWQAFKVKLLLS